VRHKDIAALATDGVEPAEVEGVLGDAAAVTVHDRNLIGYVVGTGLTPEHVRAALGHRFPRAGSTGQAGSTMSG
jgi:hypothetical protein